MKAQTLASSNNEFWTEKNEDTYYKHKKDIRLRLVGQASTAPWDKVMMGSYTKLYKSQLDFTNFDSSKVTKTPTYKGINYDQIKEIVASLPSLNSCIDKRFLQRQIGNLKPETVQNIEAQIANDIIKKYHSD